MSSQFLAIRDAVKAALLQPPALASGHVLAGREVPLPTEHTQGIRVSLMRSRGELVALYGAARQWQTPVIVHLLARATAGVDAETAVDSLLASTYARLDAMAPPPGAVSVTLDPDIRWAVDEADQSVVTVTLALIVTHITTTSTLE